MKRKRRSSIYLYCYLAILSIASPNERLVAAELIDRGHADTKPHFRRTYLVLSGHAVDFLARKAKFPPDLESALQGKLIYLKTDVFTKLIEVRDRYSAKLEAEFLEFEKDSPLRRLGDKIIAPAAGNELDELAFDGAKIPSQFFHQGGWHFGGTTILEWAKQPAGSVDAKTAQAASHSSIKVDFGDLDMRKYLSPGDFVLLEKALFTRHLGRNNGWPAAMFRFLKESAVNGIPRDMLFVRQEEGCGGAGELLLRTPLLQVRVLVLENITSNPLRIGEFMVRSFTPSPNQPTIRTRSDDAVALSRRTPEAIPLFAPQILAPGEKLVVPVEIRLSFTANWNSEDPHLLQGGDITYQEGDQDNAKTAIQTNKPLERIRLTTTLVERTKVDYTERDIEITTFSKEDLLSGLHRPRPALQSKTLFVFGPSLDVESVRVNERLKSIAKYDPRHVSLFAGFEGGSCPIVYSVTKDGVSHREGTILTHRGSKSRQGTDELLLKHFDGVVNIVEEESEITYIDQIYLRIITEAGESLTLQANSSRQPDNSGRIKLKQGDSITATFDVPATIVPLEFYLGARGFYLPLSPNFSPDTGQQ